MKSPIPGLSRGIQVLNLLSKPMSLDEIVRQTRIPKTTVLRILATLRREGLIAKDNVTRTYLASMELSPRIAERNDFEHALELAIARIAVETGHTVEWYLPIPTGHVLAQRHTPPKAGTSVRSWIGMVRFWPGLLDAVNCVGRVGWLNFPKPDEEFWEYGPHLQKIPLDHDEARHRIIEAGARGHAADRYFCEGGVRRIACMVRKQGLPVGVLALAQCRTPHLDEQIERNLSIMIREAAALCSEAEAKLDRTEPISAPTTGDWSPYARPRETGALQGNGLIMSATYQSRPEETQIHRMQSS